MTRISYGLSTVRRLRISRDDFIITSIGKVRHSDTEGMVIVVSVFVFEMYEVEKNKKRSYGVLMGKIHRSLREHADEVPELLSYRTYEAQANGSATMSVELFEFPNEEGSNRFFGRFSETEWLQTLQKQFFEIVDRQKMTVQKWTGFLSDKWFTR